MTALATRAAPPAAALPEPSAALTVALRDAMAPHPDAGLQPVAAVVRQEAREALAAVEAALARAAMPEDWRRFLVPLLSAVANPPDREAFPGRVATIAFAWPDVPVAILGAETQRAMLRACRYFPGPADLTPLLAPRLAGLRERRIALQRIAAQRDEQAEASMPEATRIALAAKLSVRAGELRAAARAAEAEERVQAEARRAPLRRIEHPDTSAEELRAVAASRGPGSALARMRLAVMEARRKPGSEADGAGG